MVYDFGVLLVDEAEGLLRIHPSYRGFTAEEKQLAIPIGQGVTGIVATTGRVWRISDVSKEASFIHTSSHVQSGLCAPLLVGARVIGVINAENARLNAFSENDERLLSIIAAQLATGIEKIRLLHQTQKRADEFAALYETANDLAGQQDLKTLLETIVERATALLNAPSGSLFLYDPETSEMELVVKKGYNLPLGTRRRLGEGVAGRVAQSRQPMLVEDNRVWTHKSPQYADTPVLCLVPLHAGARALGLLMLNEARHEEREPFTPEKIRLASSIGDQAAAHTRGSRGGIAEARRHAVRSARGGAVSAVDGG